MTPKHAQKIEEPIVSKRRCTPIVVDCESQPTYSCEASKVGANSEIEAANTAVTAHRKEPNEIRVAGLSIDCVQQMRDSHASYGRTNERKGAMGLPWP